MITPKLKKVAKAIQEFEGWSPGEPDGKGIRANPSVSYRNHNPGNLRGSPFAIGKRDGFVYFLDSEVGFFALVWDLWMKCQGRTQTKLKPTSQLAELITVYAPVSENETAMYIDFIEMRTGISRATQIKDLIK